MKDCTKFFIFSYTLSALLVFSGVRVGWTEAPRTAKVTFTSKRDGNAEIYSMNTDGSEQVNLTQHPAEDYNPTWSPNGKQILFSSDRDGIFDLYLMNADGTDVRKVFESSKYRWEPAWSPDGKRIAYAQTDPGKAKLLFGARFAALTDLTIYTATPNGDSVEKLTDGSNPNWSPDGREIIFVMGGRKSTPMGIFELQTRKKKTLLSKEMPWINEPSWSPRGDKITFAQLSGAGFNGQGFLTFQKGTIYIANHDGTGSRQVTDKLSAYNPTWSPQGSELIYNARSGTLQLYKTDLNGDNPIQLTHDGSNSSPDWFDPTTLAVSPLVHSLTTTWGKLKQIKGD